MPQYSSFSSRSFECWCCAVVATRGIVTVIYRGRLHLAMGLSCHAQVAVAGFLQRPTVSCVHQAAPAGSRRCRAVVTRATSTATSGSWHAAHHTYERVLRYPDGNVRYIRYPVTEQTFDEDDEAFADIPGLWKWPDHSGMPVTGGRPDMGQQLQYVQQQRQVPKAAAASMASPAPERSLSDTAAFLESLFAASTSSRPVIDVEGSYEVLHGCPWLLPRPVYVLCAGTAPRTEDVGSTYTLQVRVQQQGAASDIAKLLGKQHLAEALEVSQLRDGVVMFEGEDTADRFSTLLEEEGYSQVMVAQVDSHKLFRMAADVQGCVVLVRERAQLPEPYQLAAALKKAPIQDTR